jgi:hypothetical protein
MVALPLNAWALRGPLPSSEPKHSDLAARRNGQVSTSADRRMLILAFTFTASGIVSIGMATNLPRVFAEMGAGPTAAIAAAALMGPAQVGARILEFSLRRWSNPLISAKLANALHPIGAVFLAFGGSAAIALFSIIHGAGNGILTIARGTLPLALFGPQGYGNRVGRISAPGRIGQAVAPFLFGMAIDRVGVWLLVISSGLSLAALIALFRLSTPSIASNP